jgi:predicted amidohydrolase
VLRPLLLYRSREAAVERALAGLPYQAAAPASGRQVRVAVVQFDLRLATNAAQYALHVYELVRRAVHGGVSLVIFPEYASLPLVGLVPGAHYLAARLDQTAAHGQAEANAPSAGHGEAGGYGTLGIAFRLAAPAATCVYHATFGRLARRFQVTLLAGSLIELNSRGHLENVAYLYGPEGTLLARQVKTHLVAGEVDMQYDRGEEIFVTRTDAGRIAFPVCMDHTYYETARIAALSGAQLLIDPSANNEYYDPYAQARGVWNRVQEVQTYGVLCSGVGRVAGTVFQGRSGVYAPLGMTPEGTGILAAARTVDQEEVLLADLDYGALEEYNRREPLEFNVDLYRRYLPGAYAGPAANR